MMITNEQWQNLFRYSVALCGDQADGLAHLNNARERFTRLKRSGIVEPEAYLRKVIRNAQYERRSRLDANMNDATTASADIVNTTDTGNTLLESAKITPEKLNQLWPQLSLQHKDILYLWAWLGYNTQEIADELDLPKDTLVSEVYRLQQKLMTTEIQP